MGEKVLLKPKDFIYPSTIERKVAQKNYPKLEHFKFEYENPLISILNKKLSAKDASRYNNLYWWDYCLQNRLGLVYDTYIFVLTNFQRGFSDDYSKCTHNQIVNRLQFDYYAEIFYLSFFVN